MSKVNILLTGATGYIGGSILQRLLQHPNAQKFEIATLVRDPAKAKILEEKFGVKTTLGSVTDQDKLAALAEGAHVIIHTADSADNADAIHAIRRGLKSRHEKTGDLPHLIHTSGAAIFMDPKNSSNVYSDVELASIEALPPDALHRGIELLVIDADENGGYARTHIVTPTLVYGFGHGPLFDAGVSNPYTMAIQFFVQAALKRGSVGIPPEGAGTWMGVHIDDLADLYVGMIDAILSDPDKVSHGRAGYFIAENGSQGIREVLQSLAEGLFALGRVSTADLVPYAPGEAAQYFGGEGPQFFSTILFSSAVCKGERARREFGWTPKHTSQDILESVKQDVKEYVKKIDGAKRA
ncbi:hypothetical protein BN946_scf184979.g49 [Trametes cinnabarina]|uniref:NAD-dependent epimerase/dehydratase domain-containing protein n=1 Tax=Pycnoporus cinnabarinus TaxID=5643 RepID=A0A060SQJ1_PYCCI|nr:hypothetical protein BN946_scf184979.g49 [Trametes cinnabarina]